MERSSFSSEQFGFSTDSIVFTFYKFGTAIVTDTVNKHYTVNHPMTRDPVLPELLFPTKNLTDSSHLI